MLLDEHFSNGNSIAMEGPLYARIESKKIWKRYHFVLRPSGIYYYSKDKTKSPRELLCHSIFIGHEIYKGIGWKKKHKTPTDFTFALKSQQECIGADTKIIQRNIKIMCAEDNESLDRWVTAIRVAKYGKSLLDSHRTLIQDLRRDELQMANDCVSCANSSCASDENNVFDSDFPTGTIKRKPSMKPNLPLTSMTRQLNEVSKNTFVIDLNPLSEKNGTSTKRHSRERTEESIGGNINTLKQRSTTENMKSAFETCILGTVGQVENQPDVDINNSKKIRNTEEASPISSLTAMPPCMSDSMFSLPPPPEENVSLSESTLSLDTFPPPPTPSELIIQEICDINSSSVGNIHNSNYNIITNIEKSNDIIINNNFPTLCSNECYRGDLETDLAINNATHSLQSISTNFMRPPYKSPPPYRS